MMMSALAVSWKNTIVEAKNFDCTTMRDDEGKF